jgi:hypothetical protein
MKSAYRKAPAPLRLECHAYEPFSRAGNRYSRLDRSDISTIDWVPILRINLVFGGSHSREQRSSST